MFNDIPAASFQGLWSRPHVKWTENRWRPLRAISWRKTCAECVGSQQEEQKRWLVTVCVTFPEVQPTRFSCRDQRGRMTARPSFSQGCGEGPDTPSRLLWKATAGSGLKGFVADHCVHQQSASGLSTGTTGRSICVWTSTSGLSQCGLSPGPGSLGGNIVDWWLRNVFIVGIWNELNKVEKVLWLPLRSLVVANWSSFWKYQSCTAFRSPFTQTNLCRLDLNRPVEAFFLRTFSSI